MYLDCYETQTVNLKLVRLTNPTVGLYFAKLLILMKQIMKSGKFDQTTGFWKVDRRLIEDETGIITSEQKNCDEILAKLGILNLDTSNAGMVAVDMKKYTDLLSNTTDNETEVLSRNIKMTYSEKRLAKIIAIKERIVTLWKTPMQFTDPEHLPLIKLVNVYYDKGLTKEDQWEVIFKEMHKRVTTLGELKELVNYILGTNYVSILAALNSFDKQSAITRKQGTVSLGDQKISNGDLYGVDF